MKIAVNTRLLLKNKLDGIGWFTYNTLKNIVNKHSEHDFYFIFDRKFDTEFIFNKNVFPIVCPPPTRHPVLWHIWLKISLPFKIKKIKPDVFISPDGFIPTNLKIPTVSVIHDINFAHNPKDLPLFSRIFYNSFFPKFAKKSTQIATVSEYSKQDICKTYSIDEQKISVVFNGSNDVYKPVAEEIKSEIKQKYTNNCNYFVFIGSLHPRKNLKRLICAFDLFKKQTNSDLKLVVVGAKFFKNSELFEIYEKLEFKNEIIFTGRLEAEELHKVLASSIALTFVPYFEGFGIPILEAFYCDIPVISANITSMPEVAGEAALYVNPFDINEICNAMVKIYSDNELRNILIEKAKIQREKFSWEKTSEKLWNVIEKAVKI